MKKLFTVLALLGALGFAGAPAVAQDKPVEAPAATAPAAAPEAAPAAAAPAEAPAAAPKPKLDSGDTAWMMVSTLLVVMMAVPGLALFYGGLVRSKNMLSVLIESRSGKSVSHGTGQKLSCITSSSISSSSCQYRECAGSSENCSSDDQSGMNASRLSTA